MKFMIHQGTVAMCNPFVCLSFKMALKMQSFEILYAEKCLHLQQIYETYQKLFLKLDYLKFVGSKPVLKKVNTKKAQYYFLILFYVYKE